jgi:peptidoglycan/LPS O-acetylase OafA/YrhL
MGTATPSTSATPSAATSPAHGTYQGRPLPATDLTSPAAAGGGSPGTVHKPRLYVLDGLRLFAALYVVLYHYTAFNGYDPHPWGKPIEQVFPMFAKASGYGFLGVQLFFLISGFVICMTAWGRTPKQFLISRVTRLFPAYWFAVLATSGVCLAFGAAWLNEGRSAPQTLLNLSMLQDPLGVLSADGVYWTLWREMVFYLLFLAVVQMGLSYKRVVAFCGIWLMAGVVTAHSGSSVLSTLTMPGQAPYFTAGIAMYLMYRYGPDLLLSGLIGLSWLLSLQQLVTEVPSVNENIGHHLRWSVSAAIVTACYLVMIAVALGRLDRIRWRGLTTMGALTYPLYLLHEDIGWVLLDHFHGVLPHWAMVVLMAGFFLGLAYLVHRFVERPVSRYLKRGLTRMRGPAPQKAA